MECLDKGFSVWCVFTAKLSNLSLSLLLVLLHCLVSSLRTHRLFLPGRFFIFMRIPACCSVKYAQEANFKELRKLSSRPVLSVTAWLHKEIKGSLSPALWWERGSTFSTTDHTEYLTRATCRNKHHMDGYIQWTFNLQLIPHCSDGSFSPSWRKLDQSDSHR